MRLALLGGIAVTPKVVIEDAGILVEDDEIAFVGEREELEEEHDWEDEVELGDHDVVIPGLVNAHTHGPMTLFRGVSDDKPLMEWLMEDIWPLEAGLDADLCRLGAYAAAIESVRCGVTCLYDMYFYMDAVAEAYADVGIRASVSHGMIDLNVEDAEEVREEEFKEAERVRKKCDGLKDLVEFSYGPHAPYTCSEELLREVRERADEHGVGVHIHVAETQDEVKEVKRNTGKRPVEYLHDIGFLKEDVLAAHCVWVTDEEIEMLAESGVTVAHNPISNMKLASGVAPVPDMLSEGVNVAIGTDGCASNNNLDVLEEIKAAALLHKVDRLDPTATEALEVLEMATVRAAAFYRSAEIGELKDGKAADIVVLDGDSPRLRPGHDPVSDVVYSAVGADVKCVMVAGEWVVKNGRVVTVDEEKILEEFTEAARELASQ